MAYSSDSATLTSLRDALVAIVEGGNASYSVMLPGGGSRTFTKLSIRELQALIADYERRVNAASRGRFAVASFRRPT